MEFKTEPPLNNGHNDVPLFPVLSQYGIFNPVTTEQRPTQVKFLENRNGAEPKLKVIKLFFREITHSSSFFLTFPTLKIFWFFAKKSSNWGGKDIFKRSYHLILNLWQICHLWRFWNASFFFKKPVYFFKNNQKFERFEIFYYFNRIRRQICYNVLKKFHVQKRERISWTKLADVL